MNTLEIIGFIIGLIAIIIFVYKTIGVLLPEFEEKFEDGEYITLSFMIVIYIMVAVCIGLIAFLGWPIVVLIVSLALLLAFFKFLKS